jgi:hypothetical protein
MLFLVLVELWGRATPMKREASLNMSALNRVNVFKEVFVGYVNAGMLEPILAIASADETSTKSLIINLAQLLGLFSWLYLLTDAFDVSDTQQAFIYWDRISDKGAATKFPAWLKRAKNNVSEGAELSGSLFRDLALWFMLGCSMLAFFGVVAHRDVVHSHAILLMWLVLHHQSRQATAWRGTGYLHTLFAPSTALLPLEFCLNLIDVCDALLIERAREPRLQPRSLVVATSHGVSIFRVAARHDRQPGRPRVVAHIHRGPERRPAHHRGVAPADGTASCRTLTLCSPPCRIYSGDLRTPSLRWVQLWIVVSVVIAYVPCSFAPPNLKFLRGMGGTPSLSSVLQIVCRLCTGRTIQTVQTNVFKSDPRPSEGSVPNKKHGHTRPSQRITSAREPST